MPGILLHKQSAESVCSDEELALLARSGNGQAMELLVNRYKAFVRNCSKSYFLIGADREDVIQEGMIGLYKAIMGFKADKNVSFGAFAGLCIKRQIISAVKMSTRRKHMPLNTYVSLNEGGEADYVDCTGYAGKSDSGDPEQIMLEREAVLSAHNQLDEVLSEFEAAVLMHHLDGEPYGKIAVRLGREPKSVDNALQRIKRKVERLFLQKQ